MERIYYSNSNQSYSNPSNLIYVTDSNKVDDIDETPLKTRDSKVFNLEKHTNLSDSFPLFFQNIDTIFIPKKAKRYLERMPSSLLKEIDVDKKIAIEISLLILSSLSSTYYSEERYKELSSTIMDTQTKKGNDNTRLYPKVIKVLKYRTNATEGIIKVKKNTEGKETYQEGVACKSYSLTDTYYEAGLVKYVIKDAGILKKRNELFFNQLKLAQENVICRNLIGLYSKIELPTDEEVIAEAKRLVKVKHANKKGKILTFLHKHSKSKFNDANSRSFVEDNIELFKYLTSIGYRIPIIGVEKSGGRVVDSLVLMPSWIRKLIKIDGESIVEVDFKALHPNIAMSVYGGSKKFLTHQQVAEESVIDLKDVKIQHLSFFNKTVWAMKESALYSYYYKSDSTMIIKIEQEKLNSEFKHRITSMKMFAKEVEIMTECIRRLNVIGIYVGYVYDALFCKESEKEAVKKIMNEVVVELGVHTIAD